MSRVVVGLGANLGDPAAQLVDAVRRLREVMRVERLSSLYRSAALGVRDQPEFINAVMVGTTGLEPGVLLREVQRIETALGRVRTVRWGPRTMDIDLLDVDGLVLSTAELTLPHPELHRRAFVLEPLAEVLPGWRHPVLKQSAAELLASGQGLEPVQRLGPFHPEPSDARASFRHRPNE
jgi:2-amino-4-hydroxy-6-hydroxymethyldihydropteridine diphosphokinase